MLIISKFKLISQILLSECWIGVGPFGSSTVLYCLYYHDFQKALLFEAQAFLLMRISSICFPWLQSSECSIRSNEKKFLIHWKEVTEHYNSERQSTVKKMNKKLDETMKSYFTTLPSLKTRGIRFICSFPSSVVIIDD